jgi:hypothetical protein
MDQALDEAGTSSLIEAIPGLLAVRNPNGGIGSWLANGALHPDDSPETHSAFLFRGKSMVLQ